MSAVRKSFSQYDFPATMRNSMEEEILASQSRTFPGHPFKPRVPPRRPPLRAQSLYHLTGNDYQSPAPLYRDRPIPTPRTSISSTNIAPEIENNGYTRFQPHPPVQALSHSTPSHNMRSPMLTLKELCQSPHRLPTIIEAREGYYGFGEQFTISIGDKLFVDSVKLANFAVLSDRMGIKYYVPLNSAMKFGLLQDAHIFQKVSDMGKRGGNLPYIICAQRRVSGGRGQDVLKEGEILVLKQQLQRGWQTGLLCFSLQSNREIHLAKNIKGPFTTDPESTAMYINNFFHHFSEVLPCRVRLYPPPTSHYSKGKEFKLIKETTLPSLVVSNVGASSDEMFNIIVDDSISTLKISLFDKPTRVKPRPNKQYTKLIATNRLQQSFYTTVRPVYDTTTDESSDEDNVYEVIGGVEERLGENRVRMILSKEQENRLYLKNLSMQQVGELLSKLGMEQYRGVFFAKGVSGGILAELNESNLENMNIHDACHQQMLLRIINGEISAKSLK